MEKCKSCKSEIKPDYEFCPKCGEPLTEYAENMRKEDRRGAMLEVIAILADKLQDAKDLEILKELNNKLKP